MSAATIRDLRSFLDHLKASHIFYTLADPTEGAVMVEVSVPGERWEIEFHEDGRVSVEVFMASQGVKGPDVLEDLFRRFSD